MAFVATCRVCRMKVRVGKPCEHLRLEDDGRPYLVHQGHSMEPDPYAEVRNEPDPVPTEKK